jgi:hypothetical protein
VSRRILGIYLLCGSLYEIAADYRYIHNYSNSWMWTPRPGLLILLDWLSPVNMRMATVFALWLAAMGCGVLLNGATVRIYVVSEVVLLLPSVLYIVAMILTPRGHAVPSFPILLFQLCVVSSFSGFPLYSGIRLISQRRGTREMTA